MKQLILALAALAAAQVLAGPLDNAWLRGTTDKTPIDYKAGEPMTITLTPMDVGELAADSGWLLDWKRTGDDGIVEQGRVPFDGKTPFVYTTKIDKPGFVRLFAAVVDKNGKHYTKKYLGDTTTPEGKKAMNAFERRRHDIFFDGGAGADIDTLRAKDEPADFDAFWARQYARLDKVPLKAERIELKSPNPKARLYAVEIRCAGLRPVTGYLTVPTAVADGQKFPARLETHGYSGDSCRHDRPGWARDNEIVLNINAHGLKLVEFGATDADTKALRWETRSHDQTYAFDPKQNADPEVAYFNGMVLRVKRALQYLKTVEGWNGKDLIASGGSQGGLQTIWAAGCGEGVTRAESGITWCCDMYTSGKLRKDPSLHLSGDGWYIPWTEALGYYDAVNFAKRIPSTCFTFVTRAGIGDYCCPPMGLAKLWNAIPGNKKIVWVQGSQHGYVPNDYAGRDVAREAK
jgi:cephalosporin-C deacetylase-like acetyl esterase